MRISHCIRLALGTFAIVALVGFAYAQRSESGPKVWSAAEMKWTKDKVLPSIESVLLWGDPSIGEHGMLRRFPAGYAPPRHRHPSVERVVVISGTIVVQYGDADTKTLGPGSFSEIPANTEHAVQCGKESDCVLLLSSSGSFAILPAAGKDRQ